MPLVRPCLPPPHVAEHCDHTLHSAHSQSFGGGGGGGVGGGAGGGVPPVPGSHCSLIYEKFNEVIQQYMNTEVMLPESKLTK